MQNAYKSYTKDIFSKPMNLTKNVVGYILLIRGKDSEFNSYIAAVALSNAATPFNLTDYNKISLSHILKITYQEIYQCAKLWLGIDCIFSSLTAITL